MNDADFFALVVEIFSCFTCGFNTGSHQHNNAVSILCAIVLVKFIVPSGEFTEFIHQSLCDFRTGIVKVVDGFPSLKIDVGILRRSADDRSVRAHAAVTVSYYELIGYQCFYNVIRNDLDFSNFM